MAIKRNGAPIKKLFSHLIGLDRNRMNLKIGDESIFSDKVESKSKNLLKKRYLVIQKQ